MTLAPDGGDWFDWTISMTEKATINPHLMVVEQCNRCHCEVSYTVSGTCLDCFVTEITASFADTG